MIWNLLLHFSLNTNIQQILFNCAQHIWNFILKYLYTENDGYIHVVVTTIFSSNSIIFLSFCTCMSNRTDVTCGAASTYLPDHIRSRSVCSCVHIAQSFFSMLIFVYWCLSFRRFLFSMSLSLWFWLMSLNVSLASFAFLVNLYLVSFALKQKLRNTTY